MKSKFFIDRPILSIALAVMMALVGIVGYVNLPVEQFPDVAPPIVEVSAEYPGASAEAVQKSVIVPIEQAINGANGIEYISSSSTSSGAASIQVVFKNGTDPEMAVVMVKNKISQVESRLPREVLKTGVLVEPSQDALTTASRVTSSPTILISTSNRACNASRVSVKFLCLAIPLPCAYGSIRNVWHNVTLNLKT